MTEVRHTPGPWKTEGNAFVVSAEPDGSTAYIADCNNRFYASPAEHRANAELIAQAPSLKIKNDELVMRLFIADSTLREIHVLAADAQLRATFQKTALEQISTKAQAALKA